MQEVDRDRSRQVVLIREGDFEEERAVTNGKYVDEYNLLLYGLTPLRSWILAVRPA